MMISLGYKVGINEAFKHAVADFVPQPTQLYPPPKITEVRAKLEEFEEKQLAILRLLVDGGADMNAIEDANVDRSPLSQTIESLQFHELSQISNPNHTHQTPNTTQPHIYTNFRQLPKACKE